MLGEQLITKMQLLKSYSESRRINQVNQDMRLPLGAAKGKAENKGTDCNSPLKAVNAIKVNIVPSKLFISIFMTEYPTAKHL